MIGGMRVAYLSAADWSAPRHLPQEVAARLGAAGNDVVYVESLGWRSPRPLDLPRVAGRVRRALAARGRAAAAASPGVRLLSPTVVPGVVRSRLGRALNRRLLLPALRAALGDGPGPLVAIVFTPSRLALDALDALGADLVVYYCIQSHRHRPGAPAAIEELERELINRADVVVADARELQRERAAMHPRVRRVPGGVDTSGYPAAAPAAWLAGRAAPVLGYLGTIDHRIDVGLLADLARSRPQATLAVVGPVVDADVGALRDLPNVVMPGEVPIGAVPSVLAGFDVGLLPYADIPMTRYTYPAKLHQYLAAGLPVASVPLPDLEEFADLVETGAGAAFGGAVERALAPDVAGAARRREVAAANTWDHRMEALSDILEEGLAAARPRLSVVVLAWDERDELARCLAALDADGFTGPREVIVVDNGSTDGTAAMVAAGHPDVRILRNEVNRGVAVGRNQGLAAARGTHIAMLDSDTFVDPGALETLCDLLDADPTIGMAGPRLRHADGTLQMSCRRVPSLLGVVANRLPGVRRLHEGRARRRYLMLDHDHDRAADVEYLLGAAMVFRRDLVARIGGFDPLLTPGGYGFDDADWGIRVRRARRRVRYEPAATAVHGYRRRAARRPLSAGGLGLIAGYGLLRAKHALRRGPARLA